MIWATLVNTKTHTQRDSFRPAVLLAQPVELIKTKGGMACCSQLTLILTQMVTTISETIMLSRES